MTVTGILILAQAATGPGGPAGGGAAQQPGGGLGQLLSGPFVPVLLVIGVMYIFMFRSKRTQDKQKQDMLSKMKRGDRVQTIGGILGTIVEARENEILVKVDEGNNTKIKFARSAIHTVLSEEKAEAK